MMGDEMAVVEIRLRRVEDELVKNHNTHVELFSRVGIIEKELAVITAQNNHIMEMLHEMKEDVRCLKSTPAKKLDTLWAALTGAAISGIVAFVLANMFNR